MIDTDTLGGRDLTEEEKAQLTDYERGVIDGMWKWAWWKDGSVFVGTTGTTYRVAVREYLKEVGR